MKYYKAIVTNIITGESFVWLYAYKEELFSSAHFHATQVLGWKDFVFKEDGYKKIYLDGSGG